MAVAGANGVEGGLGAVREALGATHAIGPGRSFAGRGRCCTAC